MVHARNGADVNVREHFSSEQQKTAQQTVRWPTSRLKVAAFNFQFVLLSLLLLLVIILSTSRPASWLSASTRSWKRVHLADTWPSYQSADLNSLQTSDALLNTVPIITATSEPIQPSGCPIKIDAIETADSVRFACSRCVRVRRLLFSYYKQNK